MRNENVALSQASDGDSDEEACDLISMVGTVAKDFPFPFLLSERERRAAGPGLGGVSFARRRAGGSRTGESQLATGKRGSRDARCTTHGATCPCRLPVWLGLGPSNVST